MRTRWQSQPERELGTHTLDQHFLLEIPHTKLCNIIKPVSMPYHLHCMGYMCTKGRNVLGILNISKTAGTMGTALHTRL